MDGLRYCCPCLFGVESVLSFEIKRIGGENLAVSDGRISFDGDINMLARANIWLSTAERVMIELGSFEAKTFEQLFQGVRSLPFENFIGRFDRFPAKGSSLNSALHSIPDCQSIIKKRQSSDCQASTESSILKKRALSIRSSSIFIKTGARFTSTPLALASTSVATARTPTRLL